MTTRFWIKIAKRSYRAPAMGQVTAVCVLECNNVGPEVERRCRKDAVVEDADERWVTIIEPFHRDGVMSIQTGAVPFEGTWSWQSAKVL